MKRCEHCGNTEADSVRFCTKCGKPLPRARRVNPFRENTEDQTVVEELNEAQPAAEPVADVQEEIAAAMENVTNPEAAETSEGAAVEAGLSEGDTMLLPPLEEGAEAGTQSWDLPEKGEEEAAPTRRRKSRNGSAGLLIALALVVIIGGVLAAVLLLRGSGSKTASTDEAEVTESASLSDELNEAFESAEPETTDTAEPETTETAEPETTETPEPTETVEPTETAVPAETATPAETTAPAQESAQTSQVPLTPKGTSQESASPTPSASASPSPSASASPTPAASASPSPSASTASTTHTYKGTTVSGDYVLSGSSSSYLSKSDLSGLSAAQLKIARNEIYARHGRMFDDAELQAYFNSCSWYKGTVKASAFDESVLNQYEKANVDLIKSVENGSSSTTTSASPSPSPSASATPSPSPSASASPSPSTSAEVRVTSDTRTYQGTTITGDYVIADSSSRYLTESDLANLNSAQLRIAVNEIFARHGRLFNDSELQAYFNACSWYNGTIKPENFPDTGVLNEYEKANADLIKSVQASR